MQPLSESNGSGVSTMKGIGIEDDSTLRDFLDLQ